VPAPTLVGRTRRVLRPELLTPHERWGLLAEAEIVLRVSGPADFDPVLTEGLRVGAPLVLADTPLARELAGEDAILAAADQAEAWARALVELGTSTQRREELARGARRRAERFAWLAHARTTLAAYEALHAGNL